MFGPITAHVILPLYSGVSARDQIPQLQRWRAGPDSLLEKP